MAKEIDNNEEELLNEETEQIQPETEQAEEELVAPSEVVIESADDAAEKKLAEAEAQIAELKNQLLYKAAEFDNYRKRVMQEKAELIKNGGAKVISTILPILDDLERAQQNMDKLEDVAACKEGVLLIIDKFMKLLKQEGLEKIEAVGKEFDTDYHEAVAMVPGLPEDQKNKVIDCVLEGYMLNDKVIRHAKVAVAQ